MSVLSRFHRNRTSIPVDATFRLTQTGTDKLQEFAGDPKSRVLFALESRGTSGIEEISQASGLTKGQVERILPGLVRGGYVQYAGAANAMGGDE